MSSKKSATQRKALKINMNALKRAILFVHKLGIRVGIHVLPVHYHSSIPNILELKKTHDVWAKKSELPGVSVDLNEQVVNLQTICKPYQSEYAGNKYYRDGVSNNFGPGYGYIEAQALHAFIRHYQPKRIVEVGSGVSTYCMFKAAELNCKHAGNHTKIVSIEPYPSAKLKTLSEIKLIIKKVQTVALTVFTELEENDLLFIDSSHTVKAGSDVNYLILEVLPRLQKGVIVHFHDIFLPYDFQRDVCQTFLHWAETSLLHAFLIGNKRVKVLACLSHLHYDKKNDLKDVFPEYTPQHDLNGLRPESYRPFEPSTEHFPSSIYIQIQ